LTWNESWIVNKILFFSGHFPFLIFHFEEGSSGFWFSKWKMENEKWKMTNEK